MAEISIAVFVPQRKQGVPGYSIKEVLSDTILKGKDIGHG